MGDAGNGALLVAVKRTSSISGRSRTLCVNPARSPSRRLPAMSTQLCPPAVSAHAAGPPHALAGDELLAARARDGDLTAFGVIVERHRATILARTRRGV